MTEVNGRVWDKLGCIEKKLDKIIYLQARNDARIDYHCITDLDFGRKRHAHIANVND